MKKKLLSALMAISMLFGVLFSAIPPLSAFAAKQVDFAPAGINYMKDGFASKEAKLETMTMMLEKYNFQLYYEPWTGEVAVKNTVTGDILMTNPYDVGSATASDNIKNQLLSQIILRYTNTEGNEISMFSYVEAALREQIAVSYIKNGIRVEYVMGKRESRSLVPRYIEKSRYEELILANIDNESKYKKLDAFYVLKDPNEEGLTSKAKDEMLKSFPITKEMAIYVFDSTASEREVNLIESIIKEFCPAYTYETLEYDHQLTKYTSEDANPVQFRMALEYTIDEDGLSVRLPANGIRFDQSTYQLSYIRVLPYMGAASSEFTGYTMIPDGSGALVRFEDVLKTGMSRVLSGKLYGQDYAYHTISGANQQVMRMPIFGVVEDTVYKVGGETPEQPEEPAEPAEPAESDQPEEPAESDQPEEPSEPAEPDEPEEPEDPEQGTDQPADQPDTPAKVETYTRKSGFLAIIESGDSLASITTDHGGNVTHKYNSVYTEFNPRPKDSYNLGSSISVAGNATWTVVSERKFTGSFRLRFIMLTDIGYCEKNGIDTTGLFDASYVGMAKAYRYRLIKEGAVEKLESSSQIPLYVETLGVIDSNEKILSIPVKLKKALTSFEDIRSMTEELGQAGITNLVYKLTGYTNGGMVNTSTSKLKIEKTAGGNDGLKDLLEYAKDKNIGVFLDVDFSYVKADKAFDGFAKKTDAVRTIDDRYTRKKVYKATLQYFTSTGLIAVSPSIFSDIFASTQKYLEKFNVTGVSLGTVGSDLNSDFDEDDPYNREDSKENVVRVLERIKEAGYRVMLDCGNAYTVAYADHVLSVALDSSNYTYSSESVPMFGLVYHGFLNFAGTATNTAGDIRYEKLKIMENGANPYFILVYRNAEKLKEDPDLASYFSISYENWKEDLIAVYKELDKVLQPVMSSEIENHEFLIGERVPSEQERLTDEEKARLEEEARIKAEEEAKAEEERKQNLADHINELRGITQPAESSEPEETQTPEESQPAESGLPSESEEPETPGDTADEPEDPDEPEEEKEYQYTRYTSDNGMIVKVTFANGYAFILNYNIYDVTVAETGDTVIPALGYAVLDASGNVMFTSAEEANA